MIRFIVLIRTVDFTTCHHRIVITNELSPLSSPSLPPPPFSFRFSLPLKKGLPESLNIRTHEPTCDCPLIGRAIKGGRVIIDVIDSDCNVHGWP